MDATNVHPPETTSELVAIVPTSPDRKMAQIDLTPIDARRDGHRGGGRARTDDGGWHVSICHDMELYAHESGVAIGFKVRDELRLLPFCFRGQYYLRFGESRPTLVHGSWPTHFMALRMAVSYCIVVM